MQDIVDLLQIKIERAKAELPADTVNAIAVVDWKAVILGMRAKKGYSFEQLGDLELETELLLCGLLSPEKYPKELETRMKISKMEANELVNEMNDLVFKKVRAELIKNTERKKIFAKTAGGISSPPYGGGVPEGRGGDSNYHPLPPPSQGGEGAATPQEGNKQNDAQVLDSVGIKVVEPDLPARTMDMRKTTPVENREEILGKIEKPEVHPILAQKLSGSFKMPVVETKHSLNNISKTPTSTGVGVPTGNVGTNMKVDPYRELPE